MLLRHFPIRTRFWPLWIRLRLACRPLCAGMMEALAETVVETQGLARDYSKAPLALLLEAIQRRKTVEMLYESYSSKTLMRRKVDPYLIDRRDGQFLELHGWCPIHQMVRTFALDRIYEALITEETFVRRPWKLERQGVVRGIRGGPPVRVEVRFDAVVAPFARARDWSFAATFTEDTEEPGAVVMTGEIFGVEGMVRELLSWRYHAVVRGGPELRERMACEVKALAALYPACEKK